MKGFLDDGEPQLGFFWYDANDGSLFGVEKADAEKMPFINGKATINKLHKTYWQKQHHRAVAKEKTDSIFLSGTQLHHDSAWWCVFGRGNR